MTQDLIVASKMLQRAQKSVKASWNPESQQPVRTKTKILKDKLKAAEDEWRSRESKKMNETGAKTWESVKRWTGWRSTTQTVILKDPSKNNSVSFGSNKLSKIMNDFYLEKVRVIKEQMPVAVGIPVPN